MPPPISEHVYGKPPLLAARILFILILCFLCPPGIQTVAAAAHLTDAELKAALVGTWEISSLKTGYSKEFVVLNADRTRKGIGITNDRGSPCRTESDGTWNVSHGVLIQQITKTTPTNSGTHAPFTLRAHIVSIDNRMAKFRDEKAHNEMRRISRLPKLPPLVTSATWVPQLPRRSPLGKD